MNTPYGHLTYCTNIHAGERWNDHFSMLKEHIPAIKKRLSPDHDFGIGLRLSNIASIALQEPATLKKFQDWLSQEHCYVFTMNGFPYGGFHHTKVKDQVHAPDWTTTERVDYTIRLFDILSTLLPGGMEGGISTSPLSYKPWHNKDRFQEIFDITTANILKVVNHLVALYQKTGATLHLDIEPEPDGLLESGPEFIQWYEQHLIPKGIIYLQEAFGFTTDRAVDALHQHVRLCYDVCHFAVGYEKHREVIRQLKARKIKTGKIQISAALKALIPASLDERSYTINAFRQFNEFTYLHQVVALQKDKSLKRYPDLPQALNDASNLSTKEWRAHFHVPLFVQDYGVLQSTQEDIREVLALHKAENFSNHLEVETYTWEVLPGALKLPQTDSIVREMSWVINFLNS